MIYGNRVVSITESNQSISFYEDAIIQDCIVFESFLKEDSSMILEAVNLGESVTKLLQKLKEFVKSIPEKIRKLWTKLKTKLLELVSKLKKKKRVDTSSTEEDKNITFDYIPYKEAINHTSVELDVFGQLENFVDKYIDPDLDKKDYTDQQQLFADALSILHKSVVSKGEYGLGLKDTANITEMINQVKSWQDDIEKSNKSIELKEVVEKYNDFDPDDIKDFIADLDKNLSKTSSYFKGIEKSVDKMIKKNTAAANMEHYKYEAVSSIGSIVSGTTQFITSLVSGMSTVVGKGLTQHNKMCSKIDEIADQKNDSNISKEFSDAVKGNKILRVRIMLKDSFLLDKSFKLFDDMEGFVNHIRGLCSRIYF